MGLKEQVENNPVMIIGSFVVISAMAGWGLCEAFRVYAKTDKITELEKKDAARALDFTELQKLTSDKDVKIKELEKVNANLVQDLSGKTNESSNAVVTVDDLRSKNLDLQKAYDKLSQDYKRATLNCSLLDHVRSVEKSKSSIEANIRFSKEANANNDVAEYKRQVTELQSRLIGLESSLACTAKQTD